MIASTSDIQNRAPQKTVRFNIAPIESEITYKYITKISAARDRQFQNQHRRSNDCPESSEEDLDYIVQIVQELENLVRAML